MVGWKELSAAVLYVKVRVPSFEWCKLAFSQTSTEKHTGEHGDIFRSKDGCRIFSLPNYVGNYVSAMAASFASCHSWQWTQKVTWRISTACENTGTFGVSHLNWWLKHSQLLSCLVCHTWRACLQAFLQAAPQVSCQMGWGCIGLPAPLETPALKWGVDSANNSHSGKWRESRQLEKENVCCLALMREHWKSASTSPTVLLSSSSVD